MKHVSSWSKTLIQAAGLLALFTAILSWQTDTTRHRQNKNVSPAWQDTTIPKYSYPDEIDLQLNLDSVMQQVNVALSKIDYEKISVDVQKAMADIDYNKMNNEINSAMKNIDWNKMKIDISKSLDSAKTAINSIDWNEIKANVDKAQQETRKAIAAQKINTQQIQMQVQKALKDAQKNLQSAKIEMANYKGLIAALEKDGLIEPNKPYSIKLKEGNLYINGVKQSKTITDKYSRFYQNKKDFSFSDDGKNEADL